MTSRWSKETSRPPRIAVCIGCNKPFSTMATRLPSCSLSCRLTAGVLRGGPNECWPWLHLVDKDGYGEFRFAGKKYRAHRVALEIKLDRPIRADLQSMHSCDNPRCCNDAHLSEGTVQQNTADKVAKGRSRPALGINVGNAKLDDSKVLEIRSSTEGAAVLADRFCVQVDCIYKVRRRERWRHV